MSKNNVEQILRAHGPMLSTELTRRLISSYGASPEAARKQVQRGCDGMTRLSQIVFPHRARFIYLQKDFGSPYFFQALLTSLEQANSAYFFALGALIERGGAMPINHFLIACGAPISQKGHVSAAQIIERLEKSGLLKRTEIPSLGECIVLMSAEQSLDFSNYSDVRARLLVENILLKAIKDWARNLGLVSYDLVKLRDDPDGLPKVGTYHWDLSGPSYLFPLAKQSKTGKPSPGFVVCDVALVSQFSKGAAAAFLKKCVTLRFLKKVGSCLQVFVAESFQKDAFNLLKQYGVVPATPESLFGKDVAESLLLLIEILTNTVKAGVDAETLDTIFRSLSKVEGAAATLRGCLFEFFVAEIAKSAIPGCETEMNRIVKAPSGGKAEIDVIAKVKRKAIYFIECKGCNPMGYLDEGEVDKWLDVRIQTIRAYAKLHPEWNELEQHYELWSSAILSESSIEKVKKAQSVTKKYSISIKGPDEVHEAAVGTNDKSLLKTYVQHFINNPHREYEKEQKKISAKTAKNTARKSAAFSVDGIITPRYDLIPSGKPSEGITYPHKTELLAPSASSKQKLNNDQDLF